VRPRPRGHRRPHSRRLRLREKVEGRKKWPRVSLETGRRGFCSRETRRESFDQNRWPASTGPAPGPGGFDTFSAQAQVVAWARGAWHELIGHGPLAAAGPHAKTAGPLWAALLMQAGPRAAARCWATKKIATHEAGVCLAAPACQAVFAAGPRAERGTREEK
jgi:hypothetical protein